MPKDGPTPLLHPLSSDTPPGVRHQLEAILKADESAFALESEHVDGVEDRLIDAEGSDRRVLLWAELGAQPVGFVDLVLHSPEPGTATIAAVVVAKNARHRGVARALIREAVRRGIERHILDVIAAGVHRDNNDALAFFARLNLEQALGDDPHDPVLTVSGDPMSIAGL